MGENCLAPHHTSFSPHFVEHSLVKKIFFSFVTLPSSSPLQVYLLKTHLVFSFTHCSTHSSTFAQHILSSAVDFFLTCTIPNLSFQWYLSAKIIQIPKKSRNMHTRQKCLTIYYFNLSKKGKQGNLYYKCINSKLQHTVTQTNSYFMASICNVTAMSDTRMLFSSLNPV